KGTSATPRRRCLIHTGERTQATRHNQPGSINTTLHGGAHIQPRRAHAKAHGAEPHGKETPRTDEARVPAPASPQPRTAPRRLERRHLHRIPLLAPPPHQRRRPEQPSSPRRGEHTQAGTSRLCTGRAGVSSTQGREHLPSISTQENRHTHP